MLTNEQQVLVNSLNVADAKRQELTSAVRPFTILGEAADMIEAQAREANALRDALDHIMRVAREGITPTRRLDWIALRAKYALEGKPWSRDVRDDPRNSVAKMTKENKELRGRLAAAEKRYQFVLPIVTACDDAETNAKTLRLAAALMKGLDGDTAIDAAIAAGARDE